jgi:UDP-3-O-[3-hydroxymyristoyl] N-acetylglucosamine deacetylase
VDPTDAPPTGRLTLAAATAPQAGLGLNTGRHATLVLHPASPGEGIRFRWSGMEVAIGPAVARVAPFCSALALPDGTLLRTPEHLLATLAALGIDDVVAELSGAPEVPILDGSALPWCRAISAAGLARQPGPRPVARLRQPVEVVQDGRWIRAEPDGRLALDVSLDLAGWGELHWAGSPLGESFLRELAPARSFGRLRWALPLALASLVTRRPVLRGARLSNTAPLLGGRILGGARLPSEPVRHRALDLLGDLALLGVPLAARVTARRPSHALNQAFLRRLAEPRVLALG